jgi:hypothetical protein
MGERSWALRAALSNPSEISTFSTSCGRGAVDCSGLGALEQQFTASGHGSQPFEAQARTGRSITHLAPLPAVPSHPARVSDDSFLRCRNKCRIAPNKCRIPPNKCRIAGNKCRIAGDGSR